MRIQVPGALFLIVAIFLGTAAADPDTFSLLNQAREAAKRGDLEEAENYHRLAADVAEESGDPAQIAEAIGDLGGILLARGRLSEAKERCLKSLALLRESKNTRYLPVVLNNLGVISKLMGNYEQSEAYFKDSLGAVRAFPRPDPYEARVLNNLGVLYYETKDTGKAEKALKKAVSIIEKDLGHDPAELSLILGNLGSVYVLRKKWDSAAPLLDRALLLLEQSPQPSNLVLAGVLDTLGMMHRFRKNFVESETFLRKAYALRLALLGPEHPLVVMNGVKLAGTLRESGRLEDAERLYSEALALYEKTSRLRTADAAMAFEELAQLLRQTSRERNAEPLEARAKAIRFDLEHTVSTASLR